MKYAILLAAAVLFAQYVVVPSFDTSAVADQMSARKQAIEEASK